ncbi:MAG: UdgX family uracil-DNA binding protein [Planctomycetota bacterium]|nr:UdgX family uracil-DNA binding protein [Planctomycetota bacterium]
MSEPSEEGQFDERPPRNELRGGLFSGAAHDDPIEPAPEARDQPLPGSGERAGPSAAPYLPTSRSLPVMRTAAQHCQGCELYKRATQAVFGEGPANARAMLVGEQPGDQEDRKGRPFIGPAGAVLDQALRDAGIDRASVYLTNAVKHFKWSPRGKRRLHTKPGAIEIAACRPWLEAEIHSLRPVVLVALGATAAQSLFGASFRVLRDRGTLFSSDWAPRSMGTVHPSSILRATDGASKEKAMADFVRDLRLVAAELARSEPAEGSTPAPPE